MNHSNITSFSPAKLIVSGEYSVMYQNPAIAIPLDFGVVVEAKKTDSQQIIIKELKQGKIINSINLSWQEIQSIFTRIQKNHKQFLANPSKIYQLDGYFDLIISTIALCNQHSKLHPTGLELNYSSAIPIGSGLGSSASLSSAFSKSIHPQLDEDTIYSLVSQNEQYAHGRSGLLDPWITVYQKGVYWENKETQPLESTPLSFDLVNTGIPKSNTAVCVAQIKHNFPESHCIWGEIKTITNHMADLLIKHPKENFKANKLAPLITKNQLLLEKLGIVPLKVSSFIREVEKLGLNAKITGAGAVYGDCAGIVIINSHNKPSQLKQLLADYSYSLVKSH